MTAPQTELSNRAWAELLCLALIWGGSFLAIAIALREVGFFTSVLHRVGWAALILWGVVWWRGIALPRAPRIWGAFLVMGLLNNVFPFSLMAWGQLHIESGLTAILNAATAIFGALTAALFLRDERLTRRRAAGVGLGFLGTVTVIGPSALSGFDIRDLAQLAVLGGALSYALASVWARHSLTGLAPELAAAGMLTGSTLFILPLSLWADGLPRLDLAPATWGAIAYYAAAATAGAYLLYYRVLAMAGAANLMLVTLIIPIIAVLLGALVLGEALSPASFAGFLLIGLGLLVIDGRLLARARLNWGR